MKIIIEIYLLYKRELESTNQIDFDDIRNVIIASTMLVLGLGGAAISIATNDLNITISGMSLAAVIGIILNLVLPKKENVTSKRGK